MPSRSDDHDPAVTQLLRLQPQGSSDLGRLALWPAPRRVCTVAIPRQLRHSGSPRLGTEVRPSPALSRVPHHGRRYACGVCWPVLAYGLNRNFDTPRGSMRILTVSHAYLIDATRAGAAWWLDGRR